MIRAIIIDDETNSCEALAERLAQGVRTPPPEIKLKAIPAGKFLEIEIIDNGPGIPTQQLSTVFTPFFTTKEKSKNPGLGLSVSYQIVKEHLGEMGISSVHGRSTTVVIRIPIA